MKNNKFSITIGALVILIAGSVAIAQNASSRGMNASTDGSANSAGTEAVSAVGGVSDNSQNPADSASSPTQTNGYTLADVAKHNTESSCWSAVNGGVYDLTDWIYRHPGGSQAILSMCGKDASSAFDYQHGGQRRPANELAGFKIGDLKQQ